MKYLMSVFILALGFNSFCQADKFVFIQSKKNESFYVRIGDKTFNSSSFGHLVIPRLTEEALKFSIGFSRRSIPEQDFELKLNGKDRGYELNIENDNRLFLYEWLTSSKIPTTTPPVVKSGLSVTGIKRTDPFAMLMAGVVNDSLVLFTEKPVEKTELAKVPEIMQTPVKEDNAITQNPVTVSPPTEPFRRVVITPADTPKTKIDSATALNPSSADSIVIVQATEIKQDSTTLAEVKVIEVVSLIEESSSPDEKRLIYLINDTKERVEVIITKDAEPVISDVKPVITEPQSQKNTDSVDDKSGVVLMNSDCQRFATDTDVDRLRIQMLKETNDDDRVFAARKIFRTKCFTVKQITALTELFKDDAARYMLFDAAYPFVYDSGNFKSLISFLTEEYYITRFKALVRM
ncbi:MAG: DUF4476 domain-containing protein [Flavitalea sp.]